MSRVKRVLTYVGLAAAPDTANLNRLAALNAAIGRGLNGGNGNVVGYDKGDPAYTFNGPVAAAPSVARAIGKVAAGPGNIYLPTPGFSEAVSTNPDLDPYNAALLARMNS